MAARPAPFRRFAAACLPALAVVAAGCSRPLASRRAALSTEPLGAAAAATITATALASPAVCGDRFVAHLLDHTTRAAQQPARQYDSNGSGVAADDLDGDGRVDIVLGNLEGPNTILWNEGGWRFTTEAMTDRSTRAVNLVDVDGDGRLDIVTTHRGASVVWWRNVGGRHFERAVLDGVGEAAYSMSWADADGDGDLDLATASYDAELDQTLRSTFLTSGGAGVFVYRNDGAAGFHKTRLATDSQGLVTAWVDLDRDGRPELVVGNDFAMQDMAWRATADGWTPFKAFRHTSAHTMSFDAGDVDGDAVEEYFATDMRSGSTSTDVAAAWLPLMATMNALDKPGAVQRIRNVLQAPEAGGGYREIADQANVDTAGWAWSARFGDLDDDGDNDLYVANGMIAAEALHYLPNAEIVEPNVLFRNDGRGHFTVARDTGADSTASGRGSVLADLDGDGRLDLVVNNLDSPAFAYENQRCGAGRGLEIDLAQPGTTNTSAIGARIVLDTTAGPQVRAVRAGGGYLSGSPRLLHAGIADGVTVRKATVRWPDGSTTVIDAPTAGQRYEVTRR